MSATETQLFYPMFKKVASHAYARIELSTLNCYIPPSCVFCALLLSSSQKVSYMKSNLWFVLICSALLAAACSENSNSSSSSNNTISDFCPNDPAKDKPGVCGCGFEDIDTDKDGIMDCYDLCPDDPEKTENGACGCGISDADTNGNTIPDCFDEKMDLCPEDNKKTQPGICGCGTPDTDTDEDGYFDCQDLCPDDPLKSNPGVCGCGTPDEDKDADGYMDCIDNCPDDPEKILSGVCGCGTPDSFENITDTDGDGTPDCIDLCPSNPFKINPGSTGCDVSDTDGDGVEDPEDACIFNPNVSSLGAGADPTKCNYVEENGQKIFEIWTADDFSRLQNEIKKLTPAEPFGMPCDKAKFTLTCTGTGSTEATYALECTTDPSSPLNVISKKQCYDGCVAAASGNDTCFAGNAPTTPTAPAPENCTETSSPSKLDDCCTAENFPNQCGDHQVLTCKDGRVKVDKVCAAACSDAECVACIPVTDDAPAKIDSCCDASSFVESCDGHNALKCIDGRIQSVSCAFGCSSVSDAKHVACLTGDAINTPTPLLKIRLMRDIDMAENKDLKVSSTSFGCSASWTPISLYQMEFDGNNHTIQFTDGKQSCELNSAFFDVLYNASVKDLSFDYNLKGALASAVSNLVIHSRLDNISFKGNVLLKAAVSGEAVKTVNGIANYLPQNFFGAIAAFAHDSSFSNLHVNGGLQTEINYDGISPLIGNASRFQLNQADVSMTDMNCSASPCSVAFGKIKSSSSASGLNIDLASLKFSNQAAGIFAASDALPLLINNSQLHIANVEPSYDKPFYGVASSLNSDIVKSSIRIDKFIGNGNFSFLANTLNSVYINDLQLETTDLSSTNFAALANTVTTSDIHNLNLTLQNITAPQINGIAHTITGSTLDTVTISANTLKAGKSAQECGEDKECAPITGNINGITNSSMASTLSNFNVTLDNVSANGNITLGTLGLNEGSKLLKSSITANTVDGSAIVNGLAQSIEKSSVSEVQLKLKSVKTSGENGVIALIGKTLNVATIDYTGVQVEEAQATSKALFMEKVSASVLSDIACHGLLISPNSKSSLIDVAEKSIISNLVSMAKIKTKIAFDESGVETKLDEPAELKNHEFFNTSFENTLTNNWWFKRSDDYAGPDETVAKSFTTEQINDVISSFHENSWNKTQITEDSTLIDLPWPAQKPAEPAPEATE